MRNSFFFFSPAIAHRKCTNVPKKHRQSFFLPLAFSLIFKVLFVFPTGSTKKKCHSIFTFTTFVGNEDKHRNQTGIPKVQIHKGCRTDSPLAKNN